MFKLPRIATSRIFLGILFTTMAAAAGPSVDQLTELFLPPEFSAPAISPKGEYVAFIARRGDDYGIATYTFGSGKLGLIATKDIVPVQIWWKTSDQLLVRTRYLDQASIGYTLLSLRDDKSEDLYRLATSDGRILDPLPNDPKMVFMRRGDELGRANINTGHFDSVALIDSGWVSRSWLDEQKRFRVSFNREHDGGGVLRWCSSTGNDWHSRKYQPGAGEYWPLGFDATSRYLWVLDTTSAEEAAVSRFDTTTGECVGAVRRPGLDPTLVMTSGPDRRPIAVSYTQGTKAVLAPLTEEYRSGIELLQKKYADLFPEVIDASRDAHHWLVFLHNSQIPGVYGLFDSTTGELRPITRTHSAALSEKRLAPAELFSFSRRGGGKMSARLWRPAGAVQPPLVVITPERIQSPAVSDSFSPETQALVELGYAVIRVNTRGTWGFGRAMRVVPETEIASMLAEDLEDAVNALAGKKIVDEHRVALLGDGISGTLALLVAKTSQRFSAVVVINAPAKLTQNDLLDLSDNTNLNMLSNRLGWFRSIEIADQMSSVAVAPQIRIPALYLYDEESLKGRMIEAGRDLRSAVKANTAPAQFALAYSYSTKPKLPSVVARESASMAIKIATFLSKPTAATTAP